MPLEHGARLGPYLIDAEIGAGGMGHVFRATDTRLDRAVAIKVLPEHRWSDPQLRLRFEREARALSSVSHPNLCALYDVGELEQGAPYLVMELLKGETLRDRLDAGTLPIRKALAFASQIAAGLAAAHAQGVIHRDLKPENIFITKGDLLKILDFGLATRATGATTQLMTEPGMVMGTAYYMSPEQIRGTTLDTRADIFSLGVVLFEMLTGEVPFAHRSPVETMNAVLTEEAPDLLPESVDALVRRCLEKDPEQRFSTARDLMFALDAAAKSVPATATPTPARRSLPPASAAAPKRTRLVVLALILASILAAAVLSRGSFERDEPEPPRLRTLTSSGRDSAPAASPDGRLIAFISTRDGRPRVWLKQLADGTEAALTAGPNDSSPRFSPDGSVLLFTRVENLASAIYRIPILGGEPRKLVDNAFDGDWSPDAQQIAFIRNRAANQRLSTLCLASVNGGAVREIYATVDDELEAPRWSPDGKWIAVTSNPRGTKPGAIMLIDPSSRETRLLSRANPHGLLSGAAWANRGKSLVYVEMDTLAAGLPRVRGASAVILHDISSDRARVLLRNPHSAADTIDVAGEGRLVFSEDVTRQSLQEVRLDGSAGRWLSRGMSVDRQPAYARGGRSVVFASDRGGNVDLWELMLDSGSVRRLTDHAAVDWDPRPSPDGTSLLWSSNRGGHFEIWTSAIDGSNPQQVTRDGVDAENPTLPAASDWIFYDSSNPKSEGLWRIPRRGGEAQLVVAAETIHPEVSADGAFVVYQRPEAGGTSALDVVRVSDRKVFVLASGFTGVTTLRPHWIGATHTIAFRALAPNGGVALFAQEFKPGEDTSATRRQLTSPESDSVAETFTISPDGTHAILSVIEEASGVMLAEGVIGVGR